MNRLIVEHQGRQFVLQGKGYSKLNSWADVDDRNRDMPIIKAVLVPQAIERMARGDDVMVGGVFPTPIFRLNLLPDSSAGA